MSPENNCVWEQDTRIIFIYYTSCGLMTELEGMQTECFKCNKPIHIVECEKSRALKEKYFPN